MSLRELMQEHADSVFLNSDHFAETVTHYPLGSANGASVTAVVSIDPPQPTKDKGTGRIFKPQIQVTESVAVRVRDRWRIQGDDYFTESIQPTDGTGLRTIILTRSDDDTRQRR